MNTVSFPNLGLSFTINRVAFQIGGLTITWYGLLIALGILLAMWFAFSQCKKFGVISDKLMDAALGGVIGGIIGARVYYVMFRWDDYKDDLMNIFKTWEGGMAIYGGLIGGLLVGLIVAKIRKVKLLPAIDIAAMSFFVGQAIGRWGNFVNVEAFGANTDLPWGMTSPSITAYLREHLSELTDLGMKIDPAMPVHPTFLYESLWCGLGLLLLFFYSKRRRFDGEIFLMYSGWYGLGRFFIEGMRTDSLLIGAIRVSQLLAGVVVVASVIIWCVVTMRIRSAHDPNYLKLYVNTDAYLKEVADYEEKLEKKSKKGKSEKVGDAGDAHGAATADNLGTESVEVVEIENFDGEAVPETPEDDGTKIAGEQDKEEEHE